MNSNKEYNYLFNHNFKKNSNNNIINKDNNNRNKNGLFTDSDNEEFFQKNYDTENLLIKNENKYNSSTTKHDRKDINNIDKINNNYYRINYNNLDNTIPISKKMPKLEIQNIDKILNCLKEDSNNSSLIKYRTDFSNGEVINNENNLLNMPSIEELKNQKDILIIKLRKIKQKNKELTTYLEPYKQSMTNEDIENEHRLKYIKYLEEKRKEHICLNNKLKNKLMNNQNIKKRIEYLINKHIKEYEKLINDDLSTNENFDDYKSKNIYTNNNIEIKCELSLSGVNSNSDYKMNNATTDGLINTKHKNIINENFNNKNTSIKSNKLNKNNSIIFGGENKNKNNNNNNNNNNNSLKIKKNNSKSNFLCSIKYIKNSKITRNNNTSSSITSSHDNYKANNNNNNNNKNVKKNDYKLLKQNSKMANGINFK